MIDARQYPDHSSAKSRSHATAWITDAPKDLWDRYLSRFGPTSIDTHYAFGSEAIPPRFRELLTFEIFLTPELSPVDYSDQTMLPGAPYPRIRSKIIWVLPMSQEWRYEAGMFRQLICPYLPIYLSDTAMRLESRWWIADGWKLYTDGSLDEAWRPGPGAALTFGRQAGNQNMVPFEIDSDPESPWFASYYLQGTN